MWYNHAYSRNFLQLWRVPSICAKAIHELFRSNIIFFPNFIKIPCLNIKKSQNNCSVQPEKSITKKTNSPKKLKSRF